MLVLLGVAACRIDSGVHSFDPGTTPTDADDAPHLVAAFGVFRDDDTAEPDEDTDVPVDDSDEPPDPDLPPLCPTDAVPADVGACGTGVAAVLGAAATYGTVQDAVDAAAPGDVITVCPGTWTGSVDVRTRDLAILGFGAGTSVLSGGGTARIVAADAGPLLIADLGLSGGRAARGEGGAIRGGNADLCLARVEVTDSHAQDGGGLWFGGPASLSIDASAFERDDAGYEGGGVNVSGGARVAIQGTVFADDHADYGGGGMQADWSTTVTITDSVFHDDSSGYEGGGLGLNGWAPGGGVGLERVVFRDDAADYSGGAISSEGWDFYELTIIDSEFRRNTADYEGGGMVLSSWGGETVTVTGSVFTDNVARRSAGGALQLGGWGTQVVSLTDCTVDDNAAPAGAAFGLDSVGDGHLTIERGSVRGNAASRGGGAIVGAASTLDVIDSDWGTGADDNTPNDVAASTAYSAYGASATFACASGTCN
jgi:hypothetical protein